MTSNRLRLSRRSSCDLREPHHEVPSTSFRFQCPRSLTAWRISSQPWSRDRFSFCIRTRRSSLRRREAFGSCETHGFPSWDPVVGSLVFSSVRPKLYVMARAGSGGVACPRAPKIRSPLREKGVSDDHRRGRTCNLLIATSRSQTRCHFARRPNVRFAFFAYDI
jgi:hypothetical protein